MRKEITTTFTKALIAKLKAASGVTNIVGTRIRPGVADGTAIPYITVSFLPDTPHHGIGFAEPAFVTARAQVSGFTKTNHEGLELAGEISKALDGENLTVTGWGTSRMIGTTLTPMEVESGAPGVRIWMTPRRITANLCNQDTQ